jgi:hypothetical protein
MFSNEFSTFVLACPGRDEHHRKLFDSIAASDLGEVDFCLHPEGMTAWEHWEATHRKAAEAPTPFVLVLEDDCLVNRHLRHNLETWRWKHDPNFGAGWLFNPGGWGGLREAWYNGPWEWYGTVGVLYRTEQLTGIVDRALSRRRETGTAWDHAVAWAVHMQGFRIRVHSPTLVEHLDQLPSALGNPPHEKYRTSWGTFRQDWRRPPGDSNGLVQPS